MGNPTLVHLLRLSSQKDDESSNKLKSENNGVELNFSTNKYVERNMKPKGGFHISHDKRWGFKNEQLK